MNDCFRGGVHEKLASELCNLLNFSPKSTETENKENNLQNKTQSCACLQLNDTEQEAYVLVLLIGIKFLYANTAKWN